MDSSKLTAEQARKLDDAMFTHVNFYARLKDRLEKRGFPADDPLMVAAKNAYDAAWVLSRETHNLSVRTPDGKLRR
jgi:hypothetical protein